MFGPCGFGDLVQHHQVAFIYLTSLGGIFCKKSAFKNNGRKNPDAVLLNMINYRQVINSPEEVSFYYEKVGMYNLWLRL